MKKFFKSSMSLFLAFVMIFSSVPITDLGDFDFSFLSAWYERASDFFSSLRIKASAINNYSTGDTIFFGSYPQKKVTSQTEIDKLNNTKASSDGTYYIGENRYAKLNSSWYLFEPIEWRVLSSSGNYVYAFSKNLLDAQPYHSSNVSVTWEDCSLNNWLNTTFLKTAFTKNEQYSISVGNKAPAFSSGTSSKIFLLTYKDCINTKYGFNSSDTYDDSARISYSTAYSQARGLSSGSCDWTIRNESAANTVSYSLSGDGCIGSCHGKTSVTTVMGIRPAVVFDTSSVFFLSSIKNIDQTTLTFYDKDNATILKNTEITINGNSYTTSDNGVIILNETENILHIKIDGRYDYIFEKSTINRKKKNIHVEKIKERSKPYISSVHCKNRTSETETEWKDAAIEEIKIPRSSTEEFDIQVYTVSRGSNVAKVVLSQDGVHQFVSETGTFTSTQLTSKFLPGKDVVAYCIAEDGTISRSYSTKIRIVLDGDNILSKIADLTEIALVPDGNFAIPDEVPLVGGSKLNLNVGTFPVNVSVDGDRIKIMAGVKGGYDFKDKKWDEYKGWVKTLQSRKGNENSVNQALRQKKNFATASKGKWQMSDNLGFDVSFYFFWEGSIVNNKPVTTEAGGILTFEIGKTFKKGWIIGVVPCFVELALKASLSASASGAKVVADNDIPFEFVLNIKFNPSVTLGVCAGIPKVANIGIFGKAEFCWDIQVAQKYHEAYLTGKVYAQIRTFVWESDEYDLLNKSGKKWYWWQRSLDKGVTNNSSSIVLNSTNLAPPDLYDTDTYSLADRSYSENTKWVGGKGNNNIGLQNVSVEGYDIETLQTSIYGDSSQQLILCGDKKILFWITDDSNRTDINRTKLVYSVYDTQTNTWTEPAAVNDDGTADFYPNVISDGESVYVAWNNINQALTNDTSIEEFASAAEICVARYDVENNTFETYSALTANDTFDTNPILASENGLIKAVWINNSANEVYGLEGINTIYSSTLTQDGWSDPKMLATDLNAIHSMDAEISNGVLHIAYAYDMDNDYSDINDLEIFHITDSESSTEVSRLTNNSTLDSSPSFEKINGKANLIWYSENNLCVIDDLNSTNYNTIFSENCNVNDSYVVSRSNSGTDYIIWPQLVGDHVAFYCSVLENNVWSKPIVIGDTTGKVINPSVVVDDNGVISIAYNNIEQIPETIEGDEGTDDITYFRDGQIDLCIMNIYQNADTSVTDENFYFNYDEIKPGTVLPITVTVKNNSTITLDRFNVYINDEFSKTVDQTLRPGQSADMNIDFTLPETLKNGSLTVKVLPADVSESNENDNTVCFDYGKTELSVNNIVVMDSATKKIISANISNESYVNSDGFKLKVYEDSLDGKLVYEEDFSDLAADSELIVNLEIFKEDVEYTDESLKYYYFEVSTEDEEYLTGNNTNFAVFEKEDNESIVAEVHETTFGENTAHVFATVKNNTFDHVEYYAKVEVFDNSSNLIGISLEHISLSGKENYTLDKLVSLSGDYSAGEVKITLLEVGAEDIAIDIPDGTKHLNTNQFKNCSDLVKVLIPSSVTTIEDGAFDGCNNVTLCSFNNTLVFNYATENGLDYLLLYGQYDDENILTYDIVDNSAVITGCYRCNNEQLILPDEISGYSVQSIAENAFAGNKNITSVVLPVFLTTIGAKAFMGCSQLKGISLPDSVESVGNYAFKNCTNLANVSIGASVSQINLGVFNQCENLISVTVDENNDYFSSYNDILYNKDKTVLVFCPVKMSENIVIPSTVEQISAYAFSGCTNIESVSLPNSLQSIGSYAFYECTSLKEVIIPDSVSAIDTNAFAFCENLESICIGNGVKVLTDYAFAYCYALKSLTIGENVTEINAKAFYSTTAIETIIFNAKNCQSFSSSSSASPLFVLTADSPQLNIIIGDSVEKIPAYLFYHNDSSSNYVSPIKSVTIGSSVQEIGEYAFYNCSNIQTVEIPDSVKKIGDFAFYGCRKATEINVGTSVETIGNSAFYNCCAVTEITLGDSVKTVGSYAFYNCNALSKLTIGKDIETLGNCAFRECRALSELYFNAENCSDIVNSGMFDAAGSNCGGVSVFFADGVKKIPARLFQTSGNSIYIKEVQFADSIESIGAYAFYCCLGLSSLEIPDTVVSLGNNAFYGCSSLKTVSTGNGITEIPTYAFGECTALESVAFGENVTAVGNNAFYNCKKLKDITFNSKLTSVGGYAFANCSSIVVLKLPDSTVSIGDYSFYNCTSLKSIDLGKSLLSIGTDAFMNCTRLASITGGISGKGLVIEDGVMFNADKTELISCVSGKSGVYEIPDTVTTIKEKAFYNCSNLTSVIFPDSILSIEDYAFYGCSGITVLDLPDSIRTIGNYAFYGCSNIPKIIIPDKVRVIGEYSFYNCNKATSLSIGKSLKRIENYAFSNCSSLADLVIPDTIEEIGISAFYYCSKLTSITIGKGVKNIASSAFYYCSYVTELNFNATNCADLPVENNIFYRMGKSGTGITLTFGDSVQYVPGYFTYPYQNYSDNAANFTNIVWGSSVHSVGQYAFYNNKALISVSLASATDNATIGNYAFYNCTNLKNITLSNGTTSIGNYAFSNCSSLTSIDIPDNIKSIGNYAFQYCSKLTEVIIGNGVTSIGNYAFSNCSALTKLTIGESVKTLGNYAFYDCRTLTEINFNAVRMQDFNDDYNNNYRFYRAGQNGNGITVTFGDNVERIPSRLFYPRNGDSSYYINVKAVHIGDSVTEIGNQAFYRCKYLESVTGCKSVSKLETSAFYDCYALTSFEMSEAENSVGTIETYAFYNCSSLTSIDIPDNIKSIGNYAFQYCSKLTEVIIGNGVKAIGSYAFYNCPALSVLTIGESVETLGNYAFYECRALTEINFNAIRMQDFNDDYQNNYRFYRAGQNGSGIAVTFGDKVERIPSRLFYPYNGDSSYYINVKTVHIRDSVASIGNYAFYYCKYLSRIVIPSNVTMLETNCISNSYNPNAVIYCEKNTVAQHYAKANSIPYVVKGLSISQLPYKTKYDIGEPLDLTGMEVLFVDEDYMSTVIDEYSVDEFTSESAGTKTITVTYQDESVTFNVNVAVDDYPESAHPYSNSMSKTWTYTYPEDVESLTIMFSSSCLLENSCDVLYIYDKSGNLVATYTGKDLANQKVTVKGNTFSIKMKTDGSVTYYGFSIDSILPSVETDKCTMFIATTGLPSLNIGDSIKLVAKNTYDYKDVSGIVWSSDNDAVVSVDKNGLVKAHKYGTAIITATDKSGRTAQYGVTVSYGNEVITIKSYSGKFYQKVDWWKKYSSASMILYYTVKNCSNAAYFKWSSDNSKVKIKDGVITNTGTLARSAWITVTAYTKDGDIITKAKVKVYFYKFNWQKSRISPQTISDEGYFDEQLYSEGEADYNEDTSFFIIVLDYVNVLIELLKNTFRI